MTVVSGILREISRGTVIPEGTGRFVARERFGGAGPTLITEQKNMLGGWTRHVFLDVGETRIPEVFVRPIHEELLHSSVGKEVALSLSRFGRTHRVEVLSTPEDGVVKPPLHVMIASLLITVVRLLVALLGLAFFGLMFVGLVSLIGGYLVGHGTLIAVATGAVVGAFALWLVWAHLSGMVKTTSAWAAL